MKIFTALAAMACLASTASAHPDKVVREGEGEAVPTPFHPVFLLLSAEENEGGVTVYEFEVPPHSPGSPPHTHSQEDEYFFVTSGELSVLSGSEVLTLQEGDFAALECQRCARPNDHDDNRRFIRAIHGKRGACSRDSLPC